MKGGISDQLERWGRGLELFGPLEEKIVLVRVWKISSCLPPHQRECVEIPPHFVLGKKIGHKTIALDGVWQLRRKQTSG